MTDKDDVYIAVAQPGGGECRCGHSRTEHYCGHDSDSCGTHGCTCGKFAGGGATWAKACADALSERDDAEALLLETRAYPPSRGMTLLPSGWAEARDALLRGRGKL